MRTTNGIELFTLVPDFTSPDPPGFISPGFYPGMVRVANQTFAIPYALIGVQLNTSFFYNSSAVFTIDAFSVIATQGDAANQSFSPAMRALVTHLVMPQSPTDPVTEHVVTNTTWAALEETPLILAANSSIGIYWAGGNSSPIVAQANLYLRRI